MSISNLTTVATDNINVSTTTGIVTTTFIWENQLPGVRIFEVLYLTVICVLGTLGNLVVIFSIALERRIHAHGNIFIINLALADLVVTGLVVPTILANVINRGNALHVDGLDVSPFCTVIGFAVTASCTCSLCNLMFIALNRFWAVVKSGTYNLVFSRKRVYIMVLVAWLWSILLVIPTQFGWGGIRYDPKIMVCSWDDEKDLSYNLSVTSCAVILPLCVIAFCYWRLFNTVRRSGKWVRSISIASGLAGASSQHRRSMKKERALLRTLATTVVLFCCCWLPFGFTVMIDPHNIDKHAKKIFGWLAVTNSCVNFIIYGVMNPIFRRGYKNLFLFLFTKEKIKRVYSTHGSITERPQRKSSLKVQSNAVVSNKESFHVTSKNDQIIKQETIMTVASNQSTPRNHVIQNTPLNNNNNESQKALFEIDIDRLRANTYTANPRKKFKIKPMKHSSTLRGSKPVVNEQLKEEQDRVARSKRNSRMLLQIAVSDDSDEDVNDTLPRSKPEKITNSVEEEEPSSGSSSSFNENINNNNIQEEQHPPPATKSCWDPPHRMYRSNSCSARTANGTRYAGHIIKSSSIDKPFLFMDTKIYQNLRKSLNFSKSERSLSNSIK